MHGRDRPRGNLHHHCSKQSSTQEQNPSAASERAFLSSGGRALPHETQCLDLAPGHCLVSVESASAVEELLMWIKEGGGDVEIEAPHM